MGPKSQLLAIQRTIAVAIGIQIAGAYEILVKLGQAGAVGILFGIIEH